jgi:hypothetical protein
MAAINGLRTRPATHRRPAQRSARRVVRPANPNEAAVLSCLHRSLAQDAFAFETCIASAWPASRSIVLVCEVSETIAGYLCLGVPTPMLAETTSPPVDLSSTRWVLHALGVAPQFRRTGVATDLWRASLDQLPSGITQVSSRLRRDTGSAGAWFRASGFDLTPAAEPRPGGTDEDAVAGPGGARELHFQASVSALRANQDLSRAKPSRAHPVP